MDFVDKELTCVDCGSDFVFTADEQFFYDTKHFMNPPKHCKKCRAMRNHGLRKLVRREIRTTCAECDLETTVPFTPRQGRPVLCRSCFQKKELAS